MSKEAVAELTAILIHQASCLRQKDHQVNELTTANAQVASANRELADEIRRQREVIATLTPPTVLTEADAIADLADAPRPDNPTAS